MKTLQHEELYLHDYATLQDVIERLPRFPEEVHNRRRLHSALGHRLPEECEALHAQSAVNRRGRTCPLGGGHSTPVSAQFLAAVDTQGVGS